MDLRGLSICTFLSGDNDGGPSGTAPAQAPGARPTLGDSWALLHWGWGA